MLKKPIIVFGSLAVIVIVTSFVVVMLMYDSPPPTHNPDDVRGDSTIVFEGSQVELLFSGGHFTEGPAVAPDGSVYFSDITFSSSTDGEIGHIWRFDPETGDTRKFRSPSGMSNGILFDRNGLMVIAEGADYGGRQITRLNPGTGASVVVASTYNDQPFNSPNDVAMDEAGRIYFTDPRYAGHESVEQPVEGVYRIDVDGNVSLLIADIDKPNGLVISPDQTTLYVASTSGSTRAIFSYKRDEAGFVDQGSILVDMSPEAGPDGMAIDSGGNIYAARSASPPGIYVYSPQGIQLALIPTPEKPTNVTFAHGNESRVLYITAGGSLYRIPVKNAGYHTWSRQN